MDPNEIPSEFNYQELRLALAMSGGVSLAVWMGGVAIELFRVVRQDPLRPASAGADQDEVAQAIYRRLLELTWSTPRIDVIAGASAGGINGALLAMALVHDSDLKTLQSLWLTKASFGELLRSPFDSAQPSLLRGDDYFLPELRTAFESLHRRTRRPQEEVPLRLIMTTTLLNGNPRAFADDFGSLLPDVVHRGDFLFRRGPGPVDRDDFASTNVIEQLALASRSTASFPGAFEPSFVPVGEATKKPRRPDMGEIANFPASRFVVDGGVLVNKPIRPALRAIFAQPASGKTVRRVFAYVVPDPGSLREVVPDEPEEAPSLGQVVIKSLVTLPRSESVAAELEELKELNRRARGQRFFRERLLVEDDADVGQLARVLFAQYRQLKGAALVDTLLGEIGPLKALEAGLVDEVVRVLRWLVADGRTPWLPTGRERDDAWDPWPWGTGAVEYAAVVPLDLARRAINLSRPRLEGLIPFRPLLAGFRATLHAMLEQVRALRGQEEDYFAEEARAVRHHIEGLPNDLGGVDLRQAIQRWLRERNTFVRWLEGRDQVEAIPQRLVRDIAQNLVTARSFLLEAVAVALRSDITAPERTAWEALGSMVRGLVVEGDAEGTVQNLANLAIVQFTVAAGMPALEQPVEFVQISANTPNGFDGRDLVEEKVAGIRLGHFADFYKSSWRANDWMWGRLDGSLRVTQILLNPERIQERAIEDNRSGQDAVAWALDQVERLAVPGPHADPESQEVLGPRWSDDREAAEKELSYLEDPDGPVPRSLPTCAKAVARRIQLDILREELPKVARAVEGDWEEGATFSREARDFLDAVGAAIPTRRRGWFARRRAVARQRRRGAGNEIRLSPREAAAAFPLCKVGEERIEDEVGSDLFTSTLTTAAAVAVSAGAGAKGGLGPLRWILRGARNLFLALFLLAKSAVRGTRTGFAVATILLAVGGAIVSVGLIDKDIDQGFPSSFADWLGIILLAAGVLLTGIRAGFPLAVLYVGAAAAISWWPYTLVRDNLATEDGLLGLLYSARFALPVVVLVTASVALGSARRSMWWKWGAALIAVVWVGLVTFFLVWGDPAPGLWVRIAAPASAFVGGLGLAWWIRRDRRKQPRTQSD